MGIHDLAPSLQELGLSNYEARAYLTLLSKGPLSASEIAYFANLPRTKVYSTLTKLSKKRLVLITQDKPRVCTAIRPDSAFEELIMAEESKISDMRVMIAKLKKINEESNKQNGTEEHRHLTLDPNQVLMTINELILGTKQEIACIIDGWGLEIISKCKHTIMKSITKQIHVKLLLSKRCLDSDTLQSIPYGVTVRVGDGASNMFVFDKSIIVLVSSSSGKGVLFRSMNVLSRLHTRIFNIAWANGIDGTFLISLGNNLAKTTLKLVSVIDHHVCGYLADNLMNDRPKQQDIIHHLESNGVNLETLRLSEMLDVINASLGITCSATLRYEQNDNLITIESPANARNIMPWILLLTNYLSRNDISSSIRTGTNNQKELIQIKLAKKLTLQ